MIPTKEPSDSQLGFPKVRFFSDVLNDKHYELYHNCSDVIICHAATLNTGETPGSPYEYATPLPESESSTDTHHIRVTDIPKHEYTQDAAITFGTPYPSDKISTLPLATKDTS